MPASSQQPAARRVASSHQQPLGGIGWVVPAAARSCGRRGSEAAPHAFGTQPARVQGVKDGGKREKLERAIGQGWRFKEVEGR